MLVWNNWKVNGGGMMKNLMRHAVVLLLLGTVFCQTAVADEKAGLTVSGTVTDFETEAILAGAKIEAFTCKEESLAGTTTSAKDGTYRLSLKSGCYDLRYKAESFESSWYSAPQDMPWPSRIYLDEASSTGIDISLTPAVGYITGRVVDVEGKPLVETWVAAIKVDEGVVSFTSALTGENGQYVIEVSAGSYIIGFEKTGYAAVIHGDSVTDPVKVNVGLGDVRTDIDATLEPGGSIAGTVRNLKGERLEGVTVQALGGKFPLSAKSHRDGSYVIDGVLSGRYNIVFSDENQIYQPQYYSGTLDPQEASRVVVVVPLETEGVDATLFEAGSISGWVTDTAGQGVPNVTVHASSTRNRSMAGYSVTGEDGKYKISGLASSEYFVAFRVTENLFQVLFYPGVSTPKEAKRVVVNAPGDTGGIDLVLGQGLNLSGTVFGPDDEPLEGVFIGVTRVDGKKQIAGFGSTDKNGNYTVQLKPGEYIVRFSRAAAGYLEQWSGGVSTEEDAETILVTDSDVTLDMVLPRGGSISGAVSNRAGGPLAGITVKAYDKESNKRKGSATSDETGLYEIKGLNTGSFTVVASGEESGYVKQTYAQPVAVVAPKETPLVNLVLTEGGGFSGKVIDEKGEPIKGVDVEIFEPVTWREIADTKTDENGAYAIGGLPVDSYSIRFEKRDFIVQWYAGKTRRENAERVDVVDTTIRAGYDVVLNKGVPLSGVVTDSGGFPISSVEVGLYADIDDEPIEEIHTGRDGRYTFKSLAPGSYRVRFGTEDHMPKWYGGAHRQDANSIDISNAGIDDLDISLELSTDKVAGKMFNAAGEKVGQAWMTAIDANTNQPVSDERICECSGKFKIPLPAGQYKLRVERFGEVYWYGGNSQETAQVLDVTGEVKDLEMLIQ